MCLNTFGVADADVDAVYPLFTIVHIDKTAYTHTLNMVYIYRYIYIERERARERGKCLYACHFHHVQVL